MKKATRIPSVRNERGVKVRKCCASCQWKEIEADGTRVCKLMKQIVEQKSRCKKWQMSEGLKNAGNSGGRIHDKDYLDYVMRIRQKESVRLTESEGKGMTLEMVRAETIRMKYTAKGKPQYLKF